MQEKIIRTEPTRCLREYIQGDETLQEIENFMNSHPRMRDYDKKFQKTISKICKNGTKLLDVVTNYNNILRPLTKFERVNKHTEKRANILDDYTSLGGNALRRKLEWYKNNVHQDGLEINKLLERDKKFVKNISNRRNRILKLAKRIEKDNRKFRRLIDYYFGKWTLK